MGLVALGFMSYAMSKAIMAVYAFVNAHLAVIILILAIIALLLLAWWLWKK